MPAFKTSVSDSNSILSTTKQHQTLEEIEGVNYIMWLWLQAYDNESFETIH